MKSPMLNLMYWHRGVAYEEKCGEVTTVPRVGETVYFYTGNERRHGVVNKVVWSYPKELSFAPNVYLELDGVSQGW